MIITIDEVLKEWDSEDKEWSLNISLCSCFPGIVAEASFEVYEDGKEIGYYGAFLTKDQVSTKEKLLATLKQYKSEFITGHYTLAPRSMSAWILSDKITKEEFLRSKGNL